MGAFELVDWAMCTGAPPPSRCADCSDPPVLRDCVCRRPVEEYDALVVSRGLLDELKPDTTASVGGAGKEVDTLVDRYG